MHIAAEIVPGKHYGINHCRNAKYHKRVEHIAAGDIAYGYLRAATQTAQQADRKLRHRGADANYANTDYKF